MTRWIYSHTDIVISINQSEFEEREKKNNQRLIEGLAYMNTRAHAHTNITLKISMLIMLYTVCLQCVVVHFGVSRPIERELKVSATEKAKV